MTKRELVLHLLESQEWVTTNEFLQAGCGSRFGARVQELRDQGFEIECERVRDGQARYKLRQRGIVEPHFVGKCGAVDMGDRPAVAVDLSGNKSSSQGCPDAAPGRARQEPERDGGALFSSPSPSLSSYYLVEAELEWEAA